LLGGVPLRGQDGLRLPSRAHALGRPRQMQAIQGESEGDDEGGDISLHHSQTGVKFSSTLDEVAIVRRRKGSDGDESSDSEDNGDYDDEGEDDGEYKLVTRCFREEPGR